MNKTNTTTTPKFARQRGIPVIDIKLTEENKDVGVHQFLQTLGEGPYAYVGYFQIFEDEHGDVKIKGMKSPNFVRGAGKCAHCGTPIYNVFQVKTGSGEVFGVGSQCIQKTAPGTELTRLVDLDVRKITREQAKLRDKLNTDGSRKDLRELIESGSLKSYPHPWGSQNRTLEDYARCYSYSRPYKTIKKVWELMGVKPKKYVTRLSKLIYG